MTKVFLRDFDLHLADLFEDLTRLRIENDTDSDHIFYSHVREHLDMILFWFQSAKTINRF